MMVGRLDRPGRFEMGTSQQVEGHTGSVLDFDFNPFDDSMFASASEDTTIKVWNIPEDWEPTDGKGLAKTGTNMTESIVDLIGHRKKVTLVRFHPTASNVLASTSADYTLKVWDVEKTEVISSFEDFSDLMQDIVWDYKGDTYATSCKDKIVRLIDARTAKVSETIKIPHDGLKSVKLSFIGETGKFLTTGASRQNSREVKVWDLKNLSKPLGTEKIDTASGVLLPLYDNDTNVLYLAGKGDGIIRPCEFEDKAPYLFRFTEFRSTIPAKGLCMVPKRGLDVMNCESARLLKLSNNEGIHPLSFTVPRKSDAFQDDIFPDCPSSTPSHSADEWANGSSKGPTLMSLNPALRGENSAGGKKTKFRTLGTVSAELDEANERIKYLEGLLKKNSIQY